VPGELPAPIEGQALIYATADGTVRVEVIYQDETFWLSQRRMAELFGVDVRTVSEHLGNIYASGELTPEATIRKSRTVRREGSRDVSRLIDLYNLDAVISVGYRVNSRQATQFRIWATQTLKEFIVKGFVLDDERLKQGARFGRDYFDELLERIREIRASERRFYLKITDIFEQCSIDYQKEAEITQTFFATVQNKLHWAITGMTAAEIVAARADAGKPEMGLTSWKNAPDGKVLRSDVAVARNYLTAPEIEQLERIVSMYLDYAENQAARHRPMRMADWAEKLDAFLRFNEYDVLGDAGRVSHEVARGLAEGEYNAFRSVQDRDYEGDFERQAKRLVDVHEAGKAGTATEP
jgi:hypothetical protein